MGILRVIIILLLCSTAFGADLTPNIAVTPATTVAVGQEVVFNAEGTTYTPDQTLVRRGRYEWNFGDGYQYKHHVVNPTSTYSTLHASGMAVSHYFMTPGTYTVTLTASVWSTFSTAADVYPCDPAGCGTCVGIDCTPDAKETTTVEITVTGKQPVTGFEIEHAPFYNRTKQYVYIQVPAAYRSASYTLKLYVIETTSDPDVTTELLSKNNPGAEESYLLDHTALTAGKAYTLRAEILDGTSTRVTDGSKEGVFEAFFTTPSTTPITTIDENNTFSFNGTKVFPIYYYLPQATEPEITIWKRGTNSWHTMQDQYTPANYGNFIDQYEAVDSNMMAVGPGRGKYAEDGEGTVYPPRHKENHILSSIADYVNAGKGKSSLFMIALQDEPNLGSDWQKALTPTLASWQYTANANDPDHPCQVGFVGSEWLQNAAASYNDYQGSAPLFGGKKWAPTTMGYDVFAASSVSRFHGGTNVTNRTDMGPWWAYLAGKDRMRSFNSRTSKSSSTDYKDYREIMPMTGAVKPCANGYSLFVTGDSHTISTGSHTFTVSTYQNISPGMDVSIGASTANLNVAMLLTHRMFGTVTSYNFLTGALVVNITSTEGSGTYPTWAVTVEYPRHIAGETLYQSWLEVVHGSKGLLFFNYFDRPSMQLDEMETFKTQITALWPYISGAVPSTTFTSNKTDKLARVDTMIRESGSDKYMVAVRVTEPPPEPAIAWVQLNGTPGTVVTNGQVADTNGIVWNLPSFVTIGEDGTVMSIVTCDTLGNVTYVPYGMTTIVNPQSGWTSVENGYANKIELTGQSLTIPSNWPPSTVYTVNIGTGLDLSRAQFVKIARNDSAATRLTNWIIGNFSSYNSETGVMTYIYTNSAGPGTFTNWIVETQWSGQVVGASRYTGEEPDEVTATFTISGLSGSTTIDVIDEDRQIVATDGVFQDTFSKNEYHLYTIGGITSTTEAETPDTTAPTVTAFDLAETSSSLGVAIDSFTCTDNTAVTGYCATTTNSSSGCVWAATAPTSLLFTSTGAKTGYGWCKDAADNISSSRSDSTTITTLSVYTLSLGFSGDGIGSVTSDVGGISCGSTCSANFEEDTVVTLTATAEQGYVFYGWSGSGCSGTGTCAITMTEAKSVTAQFTKDTHKLYLTYPTGGTVITDTANGVDCGDDSYVCEYTISSLNSINLTATCGTGLYDVSFQSDCSGTSCTKAMIADVYTTATCTDGMAANTGSGGTMTFGPAGVGTAGTITLGR